MPTEPKGVFMSNHLIAQTSPYLIQHADNPVDWYPWSDEAFEKARREDKPVFLSIGYSTCHWCHVMAHESFEDEEVARILNEQFVSIKVDREERPDIDSVYQAACQAFRGSGGWPASIFMTSDRQPFFAGSYFPRTARYGMVGFIELLTLISEKWREDRKELLHVSEEVVQQLRREQATSAEIDEGLIDVAVSLFKRTFDEAYGGFGPAPKFPAAHNLLFLMDYFENSGDTEVLAMVESTLEGMYRGGLFDHIGFGFSRYSTDRFYLVPHFEKMLYDNALLIMAYTRAFAITGNSLYRDIAEKTSAYLTHEMLSSSGAFFSAQDADSEGVEGKYYVFEPSEIISLLGEEVGSGFNAYYGISETGNFEGKSIPNLLNNDHADGRFEDSLQAVYEYRKNRHTLSLDDKILTSWNSLVITAFVLLYRVTDKQTYLEIAQKAQTFIERELSEEDTLFVSYREGRTSGKAFLDDYAYYCFALLSLYEATLKKEYLVRASVFCRKAVGDFLDEERGGFFLSNVGNEQLIFNPKDSYDGAMPSGNSVMASCLLRLSYLTGEEYYKALSEKQLAFMSGRAEQYPAGLSFFLLALSSYIHPPDTIVMILPDDLPFVPDSISEIGLGKILTVYEGPTEEYALLNDKITYYVCQGRHCLPPTNDLSTVYATDDQTTRKEWHEKA